MAISTLCPGCQSLFRLPDELAGKQVRCQKCNRLLMVPGILRAPAKTAPKAAPRPEPEPLAASAAAPAVESPPPLPSPLPAPVAPPVVSPPALDGLPGTVLVEVPVKPAPPPLVEANAPVGAGNGVPQKMPAPTMTLDSRDRRRTSRPRRPTSVLAGLALGGMALLFVALLGVSAVSWLATAIAGNTPRPQFANVNPPPPNFNPPFIQKDFIQPPVLNPPIIVPNNPNFLPNPANGPLSGAQGTLQKFKPGPRGPKFNDQLARRLVLDAKGSAEAHSNLSNTDSLDPVQRWPAPAQLLPCKVFLVELEKGKKYVVQYQRQFANEVFDPYLRIEDLDGERLVEHDDNGEIAGFGNQHDMNSQVEFHPLKTATYRIICTVFQRPLPPGNWQFTLRIRSDPVAPPTNPNVALPQPAVTNRPFQGQQATERDPDATVFNRNLPTVGDLCWSADGKSFFALYNSGLLVRQSHDGLTEERQLNLGGTPGNMIMSGQGLLVTMPLPAQGGHPGTNEVWLIDPESLQVKRRFGVFLPSTGGQVIASAPGLDYAFVASVPKRGNAQAKPFGNANARGSYPPDYGVVVLDLAKNGPARFYDLPNTALAVSPDGKYLFAMHSEVLHSFLINRENGDLEAQQTSHPYRRANAEIRARIEVSPDSKFVCVCGVMPPDVLKRENPRLPGDTAVYVHPVTDLRKPSFGIDTDRVRALGFDLRADRIFTHANGTPLALFGGDGKRKTDYRLEKLGLAGLTPQQFLISPDGNEQLIRFADRICHVALKAELAPPPVVKLDPNRPMPVEVKDAKPWAAAEVKRGALTYRELELPNLDKIDPCWDAKGESLFHMESDGTLTRISAADFMPKDQLALGKPVAAMTLSAQGLVIAFPDQPEVWIVNPQTLKVERAIACPSPVKFLASHPQLNKAVAVGAEVALLDLQQGRVIARGLQGHADANLEFDSPMLTPDGKYLFLAHVRTGAAKVLRVRVEPARLVVEESRNTAVKGPHGFCITADGKHVAWYSKGLPHAPAFYPVADWAAPAFTLDAKARAMAPADGSLYVQTTELDNLLLRDPPKKEAATRLALPEGRIREFVPRPGRRGAFVASTGGHVFYAERAVK
jgi:hypothetical protein